MSAFNPADPKPTAEGWYELAGFDGNPLPYSEYYWNGEAWEGPQLRDGAADINQYHRRWAAKRPWRGPIEYTPPAVEEANA